MASGTRWPLTHDRSRVEDLLQDAWVALLATDGPRRHGYLFRVIRNRFVDLHRRERLVPMDPLPDDLLVSESTLAHDLGEILVTDAAALERGLGTLRAAAAVRAVGLTSLMRLQTRIAMLAGDGGHVPV